MTDSDVEQRLRAAMKYEAQRVNDREVAADLSIDRITGPAPLRRRAGRGRIVMPLLAAAAVAAVACGVAVLGAQQPGDHRPTSSAPALRPSVKSGSSASFTYVKSSDGNPTDTVEVWIPNDRNQLWQLDQAATTVGRFAQQRADCAAFPSFKTASGSVPTCDQGSWTFYRPQFFDSLPAQPAAVLASMRSGGLAGASDAGAFLTGFNALNGGLVQPDAVRKVIAALKLLPGVTATSGPNGSTFTYSGRIKPEVLQRWSITLDASGSRVVATSFSGNSAAPVTTSITYRAVSALGQR